MTNDNDTTIVENCKTCKRVKWTNGFCGYCNSFGETAKPEQEHEERKPDHKTYTKRRKNA